MLKLSPLCRSLCIAAILFGLGCSNQKHPSNAPPATPASPAVAYLERLRAGVESARRQMPTMIESAQTAAKRVSGGNRLFAAGSQQDFCDELIGRAGGLEDIHLAPQALDQLRRGDVVLYAVRSVIAPNDHLKIARFREAGAFVIAFASAKQSDLTHFAPDVLIDSGPDAGVMLDDGKIAPTDSVINILNAWTWTAEFISACTRIDKMPVVYQSYHLPGGRERAAKYSGRTFHDDTKIAPIGTGVLGMTYLDRIDQYLSAVQAESAESLRIAGSWLRDAGVDRSALAAMGHMCPAHYADPRASQRFGKIERIEGDAPKAPDAAFVAVLGYQHAPQLAVAAAHLRRSKLLYTSVERAGDDSAAYILYVDPHWPLADGCVTISGYDTPACPASGIVQAAIGWSLVSECVGLPHEHIGE